MLVLLATFLQSLFNFEAGVVELTAVKLMLMVACFVEDFLESGSRNMEKSHPHTANTVNS